MPIYEYYCPNCEHHLETLQGINEEPLSLCSLCGQHSLQRLISKSSFRLKGSGWYETDFKNKNSGETSSNHGGEKSAKQSIGQQTVAKSTTDKPESSPKVAKDVGGTNG